MTEGLIYLAISAFVLSTIVLLFRLEDAYGGRFILGGTRDFLDRILTRMFGFVRRVVTGRIATQIRLIWLFIIHKLLKRGLRISKQLHENVEYMFTKNREIAKRIQKKDGNSSYLQAIAEHKNAVALDEEKKMRLKQH